MCAHALTEIGKSSASFGHTDRKLAFRRGGAGSRERERERQDGREKEMGDRRGRDGLKFHNPAVSDTLD